MNLQLRLAQKVLESLGNNHSDNWDDFRFGPEKEGEVKNIFPSKLELLNTRGYFHFEQSRAILTYANSALEKYWKGLEETYEILSDEKSKEIYIELLAYRLLGHKKIKLSSNNDSRRDYISKIKNFIDYNDSILSNYKNHKLYMHRFLYKGIQLSIYLNECGPLYAYFLGQYRFVSINDKIISPCDGDTVIDCGACWGDTTIEFAASVGDAGTVYAYEFIPRNKEIIAKNIKLNDKLTDRIKLIDNAVWSESNLNAYYKDDGPGTRVEMEPFESQEGKVKTLSIDDLVEKNGLTRVDLIKMDIEGAELEALSGAKETLCKFKPNLAISIYHSLEDFSGIAPWIDKLDLGYNFHIRHFTIHQEETVLFASTE
jgi:FkbM family methyltransferase